MTRTEKLEPVVKHVEKHEQSALQAVAFSQQQLHSQQLRLQQLISYQQEYANNLAQASANSYSAVQLQEYNRFLGQLDDTIKQQENLVNMATREVEIKRQTWKMRHSRSEAMHKVVDRLEASELKQSEKIEQKVMDEFALRQSMKSVR